MIWNTILLAMVFIVTEATAAIKKAGVMMIQKIQGW